MSEHDMQLVGRSGKGLVYNGTQIRDKGEMLSLTDMWKAAGSDPMKAPAQWQRLSSAAEFIEHVELIVGISHNNLIDTKKRAGTWAHWQIAMAYAKYLSPEFHMWCNSVVRAHMEGKPVVAQGLTDEDRNAIGGIVKACAGVVIREQLANLLPALLNPMVEARLAQQNLMIRHGRTAGQIWADYNLPKLKNAPTWLGNRLSKMGCQIDGNGRAEVGGRLSRVYDPDRVDFCMKNGLLHKAKAYASERMGQGRLKLIG